jgi:phosphoadenosine phosphosulfate reductase
MVVTDAIVKSGAKISLFTLATGRLHQETIDMTSQVQKHYGVSVASVAPEASDVEAFIAQYGLNGFYDAEEAKKACCGARKIKPLNKALLGADAWLTGQRREQAVTRSDLPLRELDDARNIAKYNPLFDWTESEVWAYLQTKQVPIHPLHFQGYPSIGCEPCTRAVKAGEDIRAGRWWWLQQDSKECGLHVK